MLILIIISASFLQCHKVNGGNDGSNLHVWLPRAKYKQPQQSWMTTMTQSTKSKTDNDESKALIIPFYNENYAVVVQKSQLVDNSTRRQGMETRRRIHNNFIEGTGPFQCSLEIINENLEKRSRLIQNIGQYQCTFPGDSPLKQSSSSRDLLFKGVGEYDCFFGKYFEHFQGFGPYHCKFWLPPPPLRSSSYSSVMSKIKEKHTNKRRLWGTKANYGNLVVNDVDEIEGTGSYLCIFRGSEEGGQVFVRDVGNFRCNFQGGQKTKNTVIGNGYYQCHFQKPGSLQLIRVGVGLYVCFLAGVRRIKGFPSEISPPKEKGSFFEVLGSITGSLNRTSFVGTDFTGGSADPQGHLQLLALYQFGPEGSEGLDYGFVQALESYGFSLENRTQLNTRNQSTSVLSRVNQLGQFQYAFKGSKVDEGRKQINRNLGYNIMRRFYDHHVLHFHIILYDYAGERRVFGQNEEFAQCWAYYEYDNLEFQEEVDVRLMTFGQYNLHSGVFDWVQIIGQIDWDFVTSDGRGNGFFGLSTVYQTNNDEPPRGQMFGGQLYPISDLLLTSLRFTYTIPPAPQHPGESGLLIIYGNYNHYLQLAEERASWVYVLIRYDRVIEGNDGEALFRPRGTVGSVRVVALYELDFPDMKLSNGMWHVLVNYAIDLKVVADSLGIFPTGSITDVPLLNGVVTFSGLLQCLFFGFGRDVKYIYYVVFTISYQVTTGSFRINGTQQQNNWGGQQDVRILAQFFQEVRNDNVEPSQEEDDDEDNFI